jgi:hypothetical protein
MTNEKKDILDRVVRHLIYKENWHMSSLGEGCSPDDNWKEYIDNRPIDAEDAAECAEASLNSILELRGDIKDEEIKLLLLPLILVAK